MFLLIGIFYTSIIKVTDDIYSARYFHHGTYCNLMNVCLNKATAELGISGNVIPYSVYTEADVKLEREMHAKKYSSKRKGNLLEKYNLIAQL